MLVMLFEMEAYEHIDEQKLKVFLDKNLILKDLSVESQKVGYKRQIDAFPVSNKYPFQSRIKMISTIFYAMIRMVSRMKISSSINTCEFESLGTRITEYRNGAKQPKLHPDVNSLIIELQQVLVGSTLL